VRLDIAYDGRDFSGWARQPHPPGLRTVQDTLEEVFGHLLGSAVTVTCAGRTDAGVHARGQVAHLDVATLPAEVDVRRVNRALPSDVRVTRISPVPAAFDARFSAIWRRYTYRVCDDGIGPAPLDRWSVLPWHRSLRIDALNEASMALVGEHDFASFCKPRDFGTTVRAVQVLRWHRDAEGIAVMTVQADAFCHSMVRSLVGVLLPVGDGRRATTWPAEILRSGQRHSAVTVMPAFPLVLEEVGYPPDDQLLERQRQTRSLRSLGALAKDGD
jgi:tRNA pseudouridine38-40 synthase